jgi:anti-sigma factor RsiW
MSIRPWWIVAAAAAIAAVAVVGVLAVSVTAPVDGRAVAAPVAQMSDEEQVHRPGRPLRVGLER